MSSEKSYRYFDLIMAVFVTVLVVSNVASSAKIVDLRFSLFGVAMAFDAGTLLFPLSYIFGDILTEVYGYRRSRRVIWTGFFCLVLASGVFALVGLLPGEATWQGYAGTRLMRPCSAACPAAGSCSARWRDSGAASSPILSRWRR